MRCRLGLHKWGLMWSDRLVWSRQWVLWVCCSRCGKRQ